jgi:hypothetical protein
MPFTPEALAETAKIVGGAIAGASFAGWYAWRLFKKQESFKSHRDAQDDERGFWQAIDANDHEKACDRAATILTSVLTPTQRARWRNNCAFALVQLGRYPEAELMIRGIDRRLWKGLDERQKAVAIGNLAWICYYSPDPSVRKKSMRAIDNLKSACKIQNDSPLGWLQLWSRRRNFDCGFVPPYAVVGRLLACRGDLRAAAEAFEWEVKIEGRRAVGAQIALGFLGKSISEEKKARASLDSVDLYYAPPSTRDHQRASLEFALWMTEKNLSKGLGPDNRFYELQAKGSKAQYYAHCALADVRSYFQADVPLVRKMKAEFVTRLLDAYAATAKGSLTPIEHLKWMRCQLGLPSRRTTRPPGRVHLSSMT